MAEWLSKRLYNLARKSLSALMDRNVDVQFVVHQEERASLSVGVSTQNDGGTSSKVCLNKFNPKHTFDNFVTGDCNRLAYTAAVEATKNPAKTYNPLFIYSDAGQGKTHLLHAIGNAATKNSLKAVYTYGEQFKIYQAREVTALPRRAYHTD